MTTKEIIKTLTDDIATGRFATNQKLPSEAKLCEHFGVSRMTVRAALAELRRRGLIETRNGAGSYLSRWAMRKSGIIGLIIPDFAKFSFFGDLRNELERHARRLNYRIELVTSTETAPKRIVADIKQRVQELAKRAPEGVIFRPYVSDALYKASQELVKELKQSEIPVVLFDADITHPPVRSGYDLIAVDNVVAGRRLAEHLADRGYQRIAFLASMGKLAANANWSDRLFGLAGELALRGCENPVRTLYFSPDDVRSVTHALRGESAPDAIVCGNDDNAIALMKTLNELGKRIPEDVAVLGFDNIDQSRLCTPPLTTISQPTAKLAATVLKALLTRIRNPEGEAREIRLPVPIVVRTST